MDDVELPPIPASSAHSTRPSRPTVLTRKRTREEYLVEDDVPPSATSSDPALFSGDEAAPGLELYQTKRKRKMYTGSWYSHRAKARKEDKKREFKRNVDSGIFMGSESETLSSDSIGSLEDALMQDQLKKANDEMFKSKPTRPWIASGIPARAPPFHTPTTRLPEHDLVAQIVRGCLEQGREDVDLSCVRYPTVETPMLTVSDGRSISLSSLPPEIADLATLTKQPDLVSGMLEHGTELETHLRLFLSNNIFRTVPREILNLTNLRVLSLRQNKLTSLPAGIRRLINLETLNVSGNKLSHLPFEVIELRRFHNLRELHTEPNAWQPFTPLNGWTLFEQYGLGRASGRLGEHITGTSQNRTMASLFEQTLRQLCQLQPQHDLQSLMPTSTPETVSVGLSDVHSAIVEGSRRCTYCHRLLVQPEFEWIEWWSFISPDIKPIGHASPVKQPDLWFPVKRMRCVRDCSGNANMWIDVSGEHVDTAIH